MTLLFNVSFALIPICCSHTRPTDIYRCPTLPMRCYLPPDSGLCPIEEMNKDTIGKDELQVRYYFDPVTGKCYPFGTQNCGGNENRFENLRECQSICTKHKHTLFRQLRQ